MSSRRFYHPNLADDLIQLDDAQAQHARKVLRLAVGDTVQLFDGAGGSATGRITRCDRQVHIAIADRRTLKPARPWIDLAVCTPKGDRAAFLVEKASELGADRIIPLIAQRSVVEPGEGKIERFERMAVESAKQCGRPWVMQVSPPVALEQLVAAADHDLRLIADVPADAPDAAIAGQVLPGLAAEAQRVIVLIGPEGGWTEAERNAAFSAGFKPVKLGPNVMRVETAALAAVAILRSAS